MNNVEPEHFERSRLLRLSQVVRKGRTLVALSLFIPRPLVLVVRNAKKFLVQFKMLYVRNGTLDI
jgi:hypothetical protein